MKILFACEFSQIVTEAFALKGHDVLSCDFEPAEKHYPHYQGDVMDVINDGWDMMVCFPPCTHIAVSGSSSFAEKILDGRQQQGIDFFMKMVGAPIPKIAIENPICIMSSEYRKPDQIINPYYFGDPIPKKTCLWLKNLPRLIHTPVDTLFETKTHVEPEYFIYKSKKNKSGISKYSKFGKLGSGKGKERSVFHKGIAQAMANQWGNINTQ